MPAYPDIEEPLFTSTGIPFEYLYENYQEDYVTRATTSLMKARCSWDERQQFAKDMEGSTTGMVGASYYQRLLPREHPMMPYLFCTRCTLLGGAGSNDQNVNARVFEELEDPDTGDLLTFPTGGFSMDWAIFAVSFERLPYFVVSDDAVIPKTIPELYRYCMISERPRAREFTVNSFQLHPQDDVTNEQLLRTPAFIMDREQDIVITTYQIPAALYPYSAIDTCLGKTNSEVIELPISFAGFVNGEAAYVTRTYAVDTLLFRGVATDIVMYPGPTGGSDSLPWYRDLPLVFTYRPNGWRKLRRPANPYDYTTMVYVNSSPTTYMYDQTAFAAMFKPTT